MIQAWSNVRNDVNDAIDKFFIKIAEVMASFFSEAGAISSFFWNSFYWNDGT